MRISLTLITKFETFNRYKFLVFYRRNSFKIYFLTIKRLFFHY